MLCRVTLKHGVLLLGSCLPSWYSGLYWDSSLRRVLSLPLTRNGLAGLFLVQPMLLEMSLQHDRHVETLNLESTDVIFHL